MKRLIWIGVLSLVSLIGVAAKPKAAECAWCPSYACFARCSSECSCVTVGGSFGGQCVSVNQVPELKEHGYTVIP